MPFRQLDSYKAILKLKFKDVTTPTMCSHGTVMFKRKRKERNYSPSIMEKYFRERRHYKGEMPGIYQSEPNKTWMYGIYPNGYIRKATSLHSCNCTGEYKAEFHYKKPLGDKKPMYFKLKDYDNAFKWVIENIRKSRVK